MNTINPITSEDELLKESQLNTPVVAAPVAQIEPVYMPQPTNILSVESESVQNLVGNDEKTTSESQFVYRLPMFSYILTWIYGLIAAYNAWVIWGLSQSSLGGVMNSYYADKPFYDNPVIVAWMLLVACLLSAIFLIRGNRLLRYITIAISALISVYILYYIFGVIQIQKVFAVQSYYQSDNSSNNFNLYAYYFAPFLFALSLPISTVVHLLRAKTVAAYK